MVRTRLLCLLVNSQNYVLTSRVSDFDVFPFLLFLHFLVLLVLLAQNRFGPPFVQTRGVAPRCSRTSSHLGFGPEPRARYPGVVSVCTLELMHPPIVRFLPVTTFGPFLGPFLGPKTHPFLSTFSAGPKTQYLSEKPTFGGPKWPLFGPKIWPQKWPLFGPKKGSKNTPFAKQVLSTFLRLTCNSAHRSKKAQNITFDPLFGPKMTPVLDPQKSVFRTSFGLFGVRFWTQKVKCQLCTFWYPPKKWSFLCTLRNWPFFDPFLGPKQDPLLTTHWNASGLLSALTMSRGVWNRVPKVTPKRPQKWPIPSIDLCINC